MLYASGIFANVNKLLSICLTSKLSISLFIISAFLSPLEGEKNGKIPYPEESKMYRA